MNARGWIGAAALVLVGAGAWAWLGGDGAPAPVPPPPAASPPAAPPTTAAPPPPPAPSPAGALGIHGVVLRDGNPAAARVTAWISIEDAFAREFCASEPRGAADAGQDGTFRIEGLVEGTYRLEAVAADGARGRATAWLGPEEEEPAAIPLQSGTCTLRGRALLPDGKPWTGPLALRDGDFFWEVPFPLTVDAAGRFRVEGLPEREFRLAALEPGRRLVEGPTVLLPCEEEVLFVVGAGWTDRAGSVVADADGAPVAGATVRARFGANGDAGEAAATTGADGRFVLPVPRDVAVELEAAAGGFAVARASTEPAGDPLLDFRLRRFASLAGRVLDADGKPVAGVAVIVLPGPWGDGEGPEGGFRTTSGAGGRYRLDRLPPGPAQVLALGEGRISRGVSGAGDGNLEASGLELLPGDGNERDIAVVPAPRARGRVVDASGAPVAGAAVEAEKPGVYRNSAQWILWSLDPSAAGTATEADGTFTFPILMPGLDYGFIASRDGHRLASAGPFHAEPGREMDVLLALPAERFTTVRVVEAEGGAPVPGAVVEANALLLPGENLDLPGAWTTGEDGTVRVGPLPAGAVSLRARSEDGGRSSDSVDLPEGEVPAPDIPLPAARERRDLVVEGVVLLPDGTPAAGAQLSLWSSPMGCMNFEVFPPPRTDFRGRFRVEGIGGSINMQTTLVRGGRTYRGWVSRDVEEGVEVLRDLVVPLHDEAMEDSGLDEEGERPRLTVRVVGPDGEPVPRGEVDFHFLGVREGDHIAMRRLHEGRAAARVPEQEPAGSVWIKVDGAEDEDGTPLPFGFKTFGPFPPPVADTEVEVALESGLALSGRVLDPAGRGLQGVHVRVQTEFPELAPSPWFHVEWEADAVTGEDGSFLLGGLGNREYGVFVEPPTAWAPDPGRRARPGSGDLEFRLRPSAGAVVTVVDEAGVPVAGARVETSSTVDSSRSEERADTDGAGRCRIDGLDPAAPHRLRVSRPEEREDLTDVELPSWMPKDTTVTLPTSLRLEVTVRDPAGLPLEGIVVSWEATASPGAWRGSTTDGNGRVRFRDLPAGDLRITAALPGAGAGSLPSSSIVLPSHAGTAALVLDPRGSAVLRVPGIDEDGRLLASFARAEDLEPGQAGSAGDGRIRLRGLAPGEDYNVYVRDLTTDRCALLRGVRAGDPEREVVLVPGKTITGRAILPEGEDFCSVALLVGKTILIDGQPGEGGSFTFPAVPEGTWTVVAYLTTEDGEYHAATATVEAGGTVEFRVP